MRREEDQPKYEPLQAVLPDVVEQLDRLYLQSEAERLTGYSTGFADLDRMTLGLRPGELIVLAGRPGMGKISLAMNLCLQVARSQALPVGVAPLDSSPASWVRRMLSIASGVGAYALHTGQLSEADWPRIAQGLQVLQEARCSFLDPVIADPAALFRNIRQLAWSSGGLSMLVVSRLQFLLVPGGPAEQSYDIANLAQLFKALARELCCPVLLLSSSPRPRGRENRPPMLRDLENQWGLVEYADLVLFLYREECYNPDTPNKGTVECIVGKDRNGSGPGTVRLMFDQDCGRFRDMGYRPLSGELTEEGSLD